MSNRRKILPLIVIGCIIASVASASVLLYFRQETINVTSNPVLYVNGSPSEGVNEFTNITINAGESFEEAFNISYVGNLGAFPINITDGTNIEGLSFTMTLNGSPVTNPVYLNRMQAYDLIINITASPFLASGTTQYIITIAPAVI